MSEGGREGERERKREKRKQRERKLGKERKQVRKKRAYSSPHTLTLFRILTSWLKIPGRSSVRAVKFKETQVTK